MSRLVQYIILLPILLFAACSLYSQDGDTTSFSDLMKIALENNFSIIVARNSAEITRINNTIGNAGFLPSIDASAETGKAIVNSNQVFYDGRTRDASGAENSSTNALAELNWTLFDGAKMFITKKKLSELENQGEISLQIRIEEIYMQLAATYYGLIQEVKWMEVLASNLSISKERLILATKKFELGSASESDLIQARLDLNTDSNAVINQNAVIWNMKADINHLAGRNPTIDIIPGDKMEYNDIDDLSELQSIANQQNQELILARSNEKIYRLTMQESISNFLPLVSLYTNYSYSSSQSQTGLLTSNKSFGPAYGIKLSYNIFNGFNDKRAYEISRINYESARVKSDEVLNSLQTELFKVYNEFTTAKEVMNISKINMSDAKENLKLAVELYRYGQINEVDFREYQKKTIEAETNLLTSEYQVRMAELNLLHLSGQLKLSQ
jgi:outer membrane protein